MSVGHIYCPESLVNSGMRLYTISYDSLEQALVFICRERSLDIYTGPTFGKGVGLRLRAPPSRSEIQTSGLPRHFSRHCHCAANSNTSGSAGVRLSNAGIGWFQCPHLTDDITISMHADVDDRQRATTAEAYERRAPRAHAGFR